MRILVFLQNAWQYNARPGQKSWLPAPFSAEDSQLSWEHALWRSHTGRRLKRYLPEGDNIDVVVTNASPYIGASPTQKFPMDPAYCISEVRERRPDVILLLGQEAGRAHLPLEDWMARNGRQIPIFKAPHPASRTLTLEKVHETRNLLTWACGLNASKVGRVATEEVPL